MLTRHTLSTAFLERVIRSCVPKKKKKDTLQTPLSPLTGEPLDVVEVRDGRVRPVRYDLSGRVGVPEATITGRSLHNG